MQPIVSVIIPVYNGENFIKQCIQSVLIQSITNLQIIAIDDGSTDQSLSILKEISEKDSRLLVIHQENGGVSKARNTGLSLALGKWVVFVDADDSIAVDYCQNMIDAAERLSTDVLIAKDYKENEENEYLLREKKSLIASCLSYDEKSFSYNIDAPWAKLFRRSVIQKYGVYFPEELSRSEDAFFCMSFYYHAEKIGIINQLGYFHVEREGSLCRSYTPQAPEMLNRILKVNSRWLYNNFPEDTILKQALWYRVLPGIVECEKTFFFHQNNKASMWRKVVLYQNMLNQKLVCEAIRSIKITDISEKKYRVRLAMYKLDIVWLFVLLKESQKKRLSLIRKIKKFILQTHIFLLITNRWHQKRRSKELMDLCKDLILKYKNEPLEDSHTHISDYVWVCWWQGEDNMSPIVKECYRRIIAYNKNKKVILITENNLNEWVLFPDYIMQKYKKGIITKTHFSDLLRMELLRNYGGVWMDITLMTFSGIPDEYYRYPVYSGRYLYNKKDYNVSKNRWTSFFWVSRFPNNILFRYMSDFWKIYWKENNSLIEYFLIDYAINLGYCHIPRIKRELDNIPLEGCENNVWKLLKVLSSKYDESILNVIIQENWMQKLSYRGEEHIQEKSNNPSSSFYKKLFLDVLSEDIQ